MVKDLVPVEVDVNSAGPEFWRRYHAYRRARQAETWPDDPMLPDSIEEKRLRAPRDFEIVHHYEVRHDGEMVSFFEGRTTHPRSPGYEKNRDFLEADWAVLGPHRRRGIGSLWLPVALDLLDRHGARLLDLWTVEPSGHEFLRKRAGEPKLQAGENRLKLADVDWSMVRRWVEEGVRRSPQTRLDVYDGPLPEPMRPEFTAALSSLLNTIPFEDLDHGEIVVTPAQMADWYARMEATEATSHTVLTREPDGTISGITDVSWSVHQPTFVRQRFTGVRPDARGRGIGKWIKAAMLEKMRADHPQAEWVVTGNAESNAPMLSINHRLGFKQHHSGAVYQISRDRLAELCRTPER